MRHGSIDLKSNLAFSHTDTSMQQPPPAQAFSSMMSSSGSKSGAAPAAAASAPAAATTVQSRRAMLEEYRRQKQLQKQQQPGKPASASAVPRTTQGLRSKIQGLKSPPPAKRATANSSTTTGATTKRGVAGNSNSSSSSSSSSSVRKPMAAVDKKKIQQAGERAVAPGTPVHSLQKRLRLRSPLASNNGNEKREAAAAAGGGKYVPVESKVAAILKKPAPAASPAKQKEDEEVVVPASPAPVAAQKQEEGPKKEGKTLAAMVEEASELARVGFLPAARALLEGLGEEHRGKALYWAARARLEEEQESKDWDRAADLLEEGLICVARDEAEAGMLRATKQEFLARRTRAALASVENLLEAEEDELPAPVPTPMKPGQQPQAGVEGESDEDNDGEEAMPRALALALTPAKQQAQSVTAAAAPVASPAPVAIASPQPKQKQQQQQQQEEEGTPVRRLSTLSASSGSSVPSIRLPAVVPAPAAPTNSGEEDKENTPAQQQQQQRASLSTRSSSSDTLPKPTVIPSGTNAAASPSPAKPAKRTSVGSVTGSPYRSPSSQAKLGPFQSPLAGGAVRVPTGSTGRSLLGKGAERRPSLLMSPTNILRSGGAKRIPTPAPTHGGHEDEDEEGAYSSPSLKLFYGAASPSFRSPSMPLPQAMPGDYGYNYNDDEHEAHGVDGDSEGDYYYDEAAGDDDWAADGANEWSPEALAAMEDGGDDDMLHEQDGYEEEEVAAEKAAELARILMPPPSSAGRRMSGARRSSLSMGAARVLMSKDHDHFACPPMEMDAASGERKRTPVVSRYPRGAKTYTDSLEGLSPGGATLLAAVPRTNPDGTRVYTPVRRSTRLLSAAIHSSGKKGQSHGKQQATPSPLRRDMERLLSDMCPLSLHDE